MKYLKRFNESKQEDMKWSDRDVTNKYHCSLGWVRYEDVHKDSYIDIERYFDITFDHLGWVLEDLVNTCDFLYKCSVRDRRGLHLSHEDSDGVANYINIDLVPANDATDFKKYLGKFTHFPPRKGDVLISLLRGIEDKLIENFPYLTILDNDYYPEDYGLDKWNIFFTSSQITLKIKRK